MDIDEHKKDIEAIKRVRELFKNNNYHIDFTYYDSILENLDMIEEYISTKDYRIVCCSCTKCEGKGYNSIDILSHTCEDCKGKGYLLAHKV